MTRSYPPATISPATYTYPDGSVAADGSVLEIDGGRRVVVSFHPRWDPEIEAEGPIRMTWSVEPGDDDGLTKLTVTSSLIPGSATEGQFSGGVVFIVSGLKTAIETGAAMAAAWPD